MMDNASKQSALSAGPAEAHAKAIERAVPAEAHAKAKKTYTVFARFRRTRLTLGRALPSLDSALAFARQVRSVRFHDPEHVFVVDDETGETVTEAE
jgi:hypothetical protein